MQDIKSKKGFTIIEVVLVLAIAGLIFLMVFIALPAMQRSQRDTQRRNDYSQLSAAMTSYMTNNNGSLPAVNATLAPDKYINSTGKDPNGITYTLKVIECKNSGVVNVGNVTGMCQPSSGSWPTGIGTNISNTDTATSVVVVRNGKCDNGVVKYAKSTRAFAIFGNLESGNGTYCNSSS